MNAAPAKKPAKGMSDEVKTGSGPRFTAPVAKIIGLTTTAVSNVLAGLKSHAFGLESSSGTD